MKTVLIIAGSDPGAGAGLQQDLKTATLLGAYGLTAATALTVQNSRGVQAVHPVAPEVVEAQLRALIDDFPIDAVKIGMLAAAPTARVVAGILRKLGDLPIILDPVLAAGGGAALLDEEGVTAMREELFPLATILTPNAPEAARLTGMTIDTPEGLEEAARRLQALGPRWVLAKGGHLPGEPVDVLTDGVNAYRLPGKRLEAQNNHGSGCLLASALAAHLARGLTVPESVNRARELVVQALRWGLPLGKGTGPVNPYAPFARALARYEVLEDLKAAAVLLRQEGLETLAPEVQMNLGCAVPFAEGFQDVAAFPGRLVRSPHGLLIPAPPEFGASRHIASLILTVMETHPELRAAMNVRYIEGIVELAPLLHLRVASFDRRQESPEVKVREDENLAWCVAPVLKAEESPPDLICDQGDWGKEPMIRILGRTPMEVVQKALALKSAHETKRGRK